MGTDQIFNSRQRNSGWRRFSILCTVLIPEKKETRRPKSLAVYVVAYKPRDDENYDLYALLRFVAALCSQCQEEYRLLDKTR